MSLLRLSYFILLILELQPYLFNYMHIFFVEMKYMHVSMLYNLWLYSLFVHDDVIFRGPALFWEVLRKGVFNDLTHPRTSCSLQSWRGLRMAWNMRDCLYLTDHLCFGIFLAFGGFIVQLKVLVPVWWTFGVIWCLCAEDWWALAFVACVWSWMQGKGGLWSILL